MVSVSSHGLSVILRHLGGASFAVKDRCYKRFTLCAKVDQILMHYFFGTFWATFALEKSSPWQTFRR